MWDMLLLAARAVAAWCLAVWAALAAAGRKVQRPPRMHWQRHRE